MTPTSLLNTPPHPNRPTRPPESSAIPGGIFCTSRSLLLSPSLHPAPCAHATTAFLLSPPQLVTHYRMASKLKEVKWKKTADSLKLGLAGEQADFTAARGYRDENGYIRYPAAAPDDSAAWEEEEECHNEGGGQRRRRSQRWGMRRRPMSRRTVSGIMKNNEDDGW